MPLRNHVFGCRNRGYAAVLGVVAAVGCRPEQAAAPPTVPASAARAPDLARGGRLFDDWLAETEDARFVPDDPSTPVPDGRGGPNGDGTLRNGRGAPLPNTGHRYRFKNLFGWDLRGADGVYGPKYQAKPYVLPVNLLVDGRSASELAAWWKRGDERVPAYGDVLSDADLEDVAAFVVAMREGRLPRPSDIFDLVEAAPKGYRLLPAADAPRGRELVAQRCAQCHGASGVAVRIDGKESLGTMVRTSAYEAWLKVLVGHPRSIMGPQYNDLRAAAEKAEAIRDTFAALCDRTKYPALPGSADVADDDPRCGAHLR